MGVSSYDMSVALYMLGCTAIMHYKRAFNLEEIGKPDLSLLLMSKVPTERQLQAT